MLQNRYQRRCWDEEPNDPPDTWRRSTREDWSRLTVAERLRRKNNELISSTERLSICSEKTPDNSSIDCSASNQDVYSSISDRIDSTLDRNGSISSIEEEYAAGIASNVSTRNRISGSTSMPDSSVNPSKDLQRKLETALTDVQGYKQKYQKIIEETEDLEKEMLLYKEEMDKIHELRTDNLRLKHENGALFRVISNLSRKPSR